MLSFIIDKVFFKKKKLLVKNFATYFIFFLLFTLPIILDYEKQSLKILYMICLIICFNSLIFEGGDSYSFIYFIKASVIYLLKFIIFFINCYFFGKILSNFVNININLFGKT